MPLSKLTVSAAPKSTAPTVGGLITQKQTAPISIAPAPTTNRLISTPKTTVQPPVTASQNQLTGFANSDPNRVINAVTGQTAGQAATGTPATLQPTVSTGYPTSGPMQAPEITLAPVRGLFPDVVSSLAQGSIDRNKELADKAQTISDTYGREYADIGRKGANAQAGYLTTGTTPVAEGNAAIIAQNTAAQQRAVAEGAQAALGGVDRGLTAQSQTQSALGTAGSLAQPSGTFPFVFDPTTGTFKDQSGGSLSPQNAAATLAQKVIRGEMSYDDAISSLSYAGTSAQQMLNTSLSQQDPNFDIIGAKARADARTASTVQTGTTGGQLTKASESANQSLDVLSSYFDKLNLLQTQGIPITNSLVQGLYKFFGSAAVSSYNTALEDARTQVRSVLGSSGVNPVDAGKIVDQYLPDGMTPQILKANIDALKVLIDARKQAYTDTSSIGPGGSGSSSSFDW